MLGVAPRNFVRDHAVVLVELDHLPLPTKVAGRYRLDLLPQVRSLVLILYVLLLHIERAHIGAAAKDLLTSSTDRRVCELQALILIQRASSYLLAQLVVQEAVGDRGHLLHG